MSVDRQQAAARHLEVADAVRDPQSESPDIQALIELGLAVVHSLLAIKEQLERANESRWGRS